VALNLITLQQALGISAQPPAPLQSWAPRRFQNCSFYS